MYLRKRATKSTTDDGPTNAKLKMSGTIDALNCEPSSTSHLNDFTDAKLDVNSNSNDETLPLKESCEASDAEPSSVSSVSSDGKRLSKDFYEQPCDDLARALLGKVLVRIHQGERLSGRIVETESYMGKRDKAAHSYKGQTARNAAMFMDPGTAYVYNIYGVYCCMNISSQGDGEAVLIRALEPVAGHSTMKSIRVGNRKKESSKPVRDRDLCNGPSKLTQSLKIDKASVNQVDLTSSDVIWLECSDEVPADKIVVAKRINIAYAEDWTDKPLRFYELSNICVSVRDKQAEKLLQEN